jgi:bifunctional UDP-N-acetylglucosamine pyrophosphorylase/glucosamine-1-phosphate N-acetyltransferase
MSKTAAIILAAGQGKRMRSPKPKVLHDVLGRPLLSYVLDTVSELNIDPVIVVVGHGKEQVEAILPEGVTAVEQVEQRGTGDAVLAAKEALSDFEGNIVVLCGDAPAISAATLDGLRQAHAYDNAAVSVLSTCVSDPTGYGRMIRNQEGKITGIVEEIDATPDQKFVTEINSGAYYFRSDALWSALDRITPENNSGEFYLTDTVRLLMDQGETIGSYRSPHPYEIQGVNTRADLVALSNILRLEIVHNHMNNGVTIVDPTSTYIESRVTIGENSTIHPFTVIRSGVTVGANCQVGPFAHLANGAVLEDGAEIGNYVEVKRSTVGAGSKAKHLAYIGDATLGRKVNIGAGTITANYDGANKHRTTIHDNASTGSNSVLVAPVTLGARAKTGAGAVVTAGQEIADDEIYVGVPAKALKAAVEKGS